MPEVGLDRAGEQPGGQRGEGAGGLRHAGGDAPLGGGLLPPARRRNLPHRHAGLLLRGLSAGRSTSGWASWTSGSASAASRTTTIAAAPAGQGYEIRCARDAFVHHWLEASFQLFGKERYLGVFHENKRRFEAKWAAEELAGNTRLTVAAHAIARCSDSRTCRNAPQTAGCRWQICNLQFPTATAAGAARLGAGWRLAAAWFLVHLAFYVARICHLDPAAGPGVVPRTETLLQLASGGLLRPGDGRGDAPAGAGRRRAGRLPDRFDRGAAGRLAQRRLRGPGDPAACSGRSAR